MNQLEYHFFSSVLFTVFSSFYILGKICVHILAACFFIHDTSPTNLWGEKSRKKGFFKECIWYGTAALQMFTIRAEDEERVVVKYFSPLFIFCLSFLMFYLLY